MNIVLKRKARNNNNPKIDVAGIPKITSILIIFKKTKKSELIEIRKIIAWILVFDSNKNLLKFILYLPILINLFLSQYYIF